MNDITQKARNALSKAESDLDFAKKQLERIERNCSHDWTEAKYDPIRHEAYTIPPEYDGRSKTVPRYGEIHVPSKTEDRWTRECKNCGRHDETKQANVEKIEKKTPRF